MPISLKASIIPAAIVTLVGLGVDVLGNTLDHVWHDAPYWLWLTLFIIGLVMTAAFPAWLLWAMATWMGRLFNRARQKVWAERDQLELSAIANLSVGKLVSDRYDAEPQLSRHRSLKDAVRSGALKVVDMAGPKPNIMTVVSREDLRAFATSSGHAELLGLLAKWDKLNPPTLGQSIHNNKPKLAKGVAQEIIDTVKGKKPQLAARRDTKMRDALVFIEIGKWGKGSSYSFIAEHKTGGELPSNRMREAAKYNEVRIWGKPSHNAQHDLIPADYWKIWQIDWHSNPDGECRTERAESHSDGFRYYDLMVSKVEIENRWPPNNLIVEPDWSIKDVLNYFQNTLRLPEDKQDGIFQFLRDAARLNKITVWGRPNSLHLGVDQFYKPPEPIDVLHWRDYGFDVLHCIAHPDHRMCQTEPDNDRKNPKGDSYIDLRFSQAQIENNWPSHDE